MALYVSEGVTQFVLTAETEWEKKTVSDLSDRLVTHDGMYGAERRSGVAVVPLRAGHGLRRKVMGDVNAATGDAALALQSIGDTDIRQANRYLKKRDDRVLAAFTKLDKEAE